MKTVNFMTPVPVIAGRIDPGLPGLAGVEFPGLIIGGPATAGAQIAYSAIGLSAACQLMLFSLGMHPGEQMQDGT